MKLIVHEALNIYKKIRRTEFRLTKLEHELLSYIHYMKDDDFNDYYELALEFDKEMEKKIKSYYRSIERKAKRTKRRKIL